MTKDTKTHKLPSTFTLSGLISTSAISRISTQVGRVSYNSVNKIFYVALGGGQVASLASLMANNREFERAIKKACRPYTTVETMTESNPRHWLANISITVEGGKVTGYSLTESFKNSLGRDFSVTKKANRIKILESNESFAVF